MIRLQNVSKRYPDSGEAISQINLQIDYGELLFLTGPSGSGKSTLLKIIALITAPTRGLLYFDERNVTHLGRNSIAQYRSRMGLVFQDHRLLNDRTVYENVALPLRINGFRRQEIPGRVRAALDKVSLLHKEKSLPMALSGGEQQRVGIARAIVHKPILLLADEPTGNLDPQLSGEIMNLFMQFNQVGVATLIASHDINLIQSYHKRTLQLTAGRLRDAAVDGQVTAVSS
ncbi:MAG: cell division ATP-binding protein FtsE [Gammaproteobacteria bacterium TMED119]|mgnify:CR=1 FL=1|nr:MAG: cell division ATP-binding protein FtsE [Gammaproteobacteria bacterium TMED119]|tara:strand:- start:1821 stop:2510 length:690 start_codon:yes stop_codon:yes gene_type:complete